VEVRSGQRIEIVDVDGGQVGDFFAFCAADHEEYLSAGHTRAARQRLFPRLGEDFVSNRRRPVLTLLEDNTPGCHDMLIPACDPSRYAQLGHRGYHPSCHDNLLAAAGDLGVTVPCVPQPLNVFMDTPVTDDGYIPWNPSPTKPGDSIVLQALTDLVVVLTACAMDLTDLNNRQLTDLAIVVSG
jgi:uncharacterized protein YcgI (DUF1989 family)